MEEIDLASEKKEDGQRISLGQSYFDSRNGFLESNIALTKEELLEKYVIHDEWFTIYGWMTCRLKLSGNELMVYAVVYAFNTRGVALSASQEYIGAKCGCTRKAVNRAIKALVKKGLLLKINVHPKGNDDVTYIAYVCKRAVGVHSGNIVFAREKGDRHHKCEIRVCEVKHNDDKNDPFGVEIFI